MPSAASRPRSRLLLGAALAAIGFVVLGPLPAATASAIVSPSTSVRSAGDDELIPDRGARLRSVLDWAGDSVADQSDRLGSPSSLYEHDVTLPMGDDSASYLAQFFQQTAAAGAAAIVTVCPVSGHRWRFWLKSSVTFGTSGVW
ncbi:hypothetical protein NY547_07595 [Cnuibacter physcomitrellae]|uniref:hypothetical protein n=1 Tax=Cnuibacter physcomitrellae TaxID=1619308 RepID=UPI002175D315|nr:hypothetical protein [Cnuibacter physcomitrellae]MCS5497096.1 hypothetical protein [Cnuibacter physcomitrellae]